MKYYLQAVRGRWERDRRRFRSSLVMEPDSFSSTVAVMVRGDSARVPNCVSSIRRFSAVRYTFCPSIAETKIIY